MDSCLAPPRVNGTLAVTAFVVALEFAVALQKIPRVRSRWRTGLTHNLFNVSLWMDGTVI